jgi:hypothetical protein
MRTLILAIAICATFGLILSPAGAASPTRDRVRSSSSDPALWLFHQSVKRIAPRGGDRVSFSTAMRPSMMVGVAF